jgi:hypothetical protein
LTVGIDPKLSDAAQSSKDKTMHRFLSFIPGLSMLLGVPLVSAVADDAADNVASCFKESGDIAIAACTRLIELGTPEERPLVLQKIYVKRGME